MRLLKTNIVLFCVLVLFMTPSLLFSYEKAIQKGQFAKALKELKGKDPKSLSRKNKLDLKLLNQLLPIYDNLQKRLNGDVKAKRISSEQRSELRQVMLKGIVDVIDNNIDRAKIYFVHGLFVDPSMEAFTKVMAIIGYPEGSYLVMDQRERLIGQVDQYFYGGGYLLASQQLELLAVIDSSNYEVFEKLGSSYYMMNKKQQAIESWQTALFLNPERKALKPLISQVKEMLKQEAAERYAKSKQKKSKKKVEITDPIKMGVFGSRGAANNFAQSYISQNIPTKVVQREDMKWEVRVSKSALAKANKK